jgi:hypothetical protein
MALSLINFHLKVNKEGGNQIIRPFLKRNALAQKYTGIAVRYRFANPELRLLNFLCCLLRLQSF